MSLRNNEDPQSQIDHASKQNIILINHSSGDPQIKNPSFLNSQINNQASSVLYQDQNDKKNSFFNYQENNNEDATFFNNLTDIYPQYDKNKNYYQEFWKIYLHNEILIGEMKDHANEIKNLKGKISHTEDLHKQLTTSKIPKSPYKKKNRRTADEISKEYLCPYPKCNKTYGSDVSLNLHIKIKHGGGNKTEREKLARSLIMAELNGEKPPEINLNLPPGYLEKFKDQNNKKFKKKKSDGEEDGDSKSNGNIDDYDEDAIFRGLGALKKKM